MTEDLPQSPTVNPSPDNPTPRRRVMTRDALNDLLGSLDAPVGTNLPSVPAMPPAAGADAAPTLPAADAGGRSGDQDTPPAPRRGTAALADLFAGADAAPTLSAADAGARSGSQDTPPAPRRGTAALADLFAGTDAPTASAQVEALVLPQNLERYLSPDLWRKLNSDSSRQGVLFNALDRLRSILYQLSTFLPANLAQEKMNRPVPGLVNGRILTGSLLFADVSGFTALSERLAGLGDEGAERLTGMINRYFIKMLEILSWSGGVLLKFAGDATLAFFPERPNQEQAGWALRAGQRMLRAMQAFANLPTPGGAVTLKMKIGLSTGEFLASSVGSARRMEYGVLGPAVMRTMAAEGAGQAGLLVADQQTVDILGIIGTERAPGFYSLPVETGEELDDFEISADRRRGRGAIPWSASPQMIVAQMEAAIRQIEALEPYVPPEVTEQLLAHAQQRSITSQYRPTVVMFCNYVGLETLLERWGGDGAARITTIMSNYFEAMHGAIARQGGTITRIDPYSTGTKLLALFGAPVAHEDDAQRAIRAALAMNAELDLLNQRWLRQFARHLPPDLQDGPLMQHRIGLTQGQTFAGLVGSTNRREYTVMGDEVNLSARLMSAAAPSQILVSQKVQDEACEIFDLTPLQPIRVKGKSKPISIYQVEGPRENALLRRARQRDPLWGRDAELTQARSVLAAALAGQSQMLILQGLAGMGKSHLADVLVNAALQTGAQVLPYICRPYQCGTPYAVWGPLLRTLIGIEATDNTGQQQERLYAALEQHDLPRGYAAPLAAVMGLDPGSGSAPASSKTMLSGSPLLNDVLNISAKKRGSSLDLFEQLEDHQTGEDGQMWLKPPAQFTLREREMLTGAVIALLDGQLAGRPGVLFFEDAHWLDVESLALALALVEKLPDRPLLILLTRRGEETPPEGVRVHTLNLGPLAQQGAFEMVSYILASELAPLIHEQSGGNPLYVEEITRWLQRTRKITATDLENILQISDILKKLVLSELETLPETQREIARVGAVIGEEFRVSEVRALLPDLDPVTLANHLRALTMARLIVLTQSGLDRHYSFRQALVRDVLYNSLPFSRRRELHGALAQYLVEAAGQTDGLRSRMAALFDADQGHDTVAAAERIAENYANAEQWLPAAQYELKAARRARTQQELARSAIACARGLEALAEIGSSGGIGTPDALLAAEARLGLLCAQGDAALLTPDYSTALLIYEQAEAARNDELPPAVNSTPLQRLALTLTALNRLPDALARLDGVQPPADAANLALTAWVEYRAGQPQWRESADRCRAALTPDTLQCDRLKVLLLELAGEWAELRTACLQLGLVEHAAMAALRLGDSALSTGDLTTALTHYQAATEIFRREQSNCGLTLALYRSAGAHAGLKDAGAANAALTEALKLLPGCPPAIFAEGRELVRNALRKSRPVWGTWRWQSFLDTQAIALLFPALTAREES